MIIQSLAKLFYDIHVVWPSRLQWPWTDTSPLKLVHSLDNSPESHKQIQFLNLPGSQGLDAALCAS